MKKSILTTVAFLLGMLTAFADNISVPGVSIVQGTTTTVGISLENTATNLVSFQMDLTLPDGITINKAGCSLSSRIADEDQELTIGKQGDNIYRLTSTSFALTPISGTSGEIITLSLSASANSTGGTATLSNIRFVTSQSERFTLDDASFTISVSTPSPTITFSDAAVKALCVANWDTNHDGELSEAEAAAVTSLGAVFRENTEITSFDELAYFTGLTSIGNYAFYGCSGLTSLDFPNSVTSIGSDAFHGCYDLTSLTIPEGVTSIGVRAFDSCSGLTSLTIPEGVTSIGTYTFNGCSGLTSLTIPEGVTSIGEGAFMGCSGLTSLTIPDGVTSIGSVAFTGCSGLTSLTIPDGVTRIDDGTFENCSGLTSLTIPDGVTSIGNYAFSGCSGLTSLTIPESVTSIGDGAFSYCRGLTSLTIPEGVTSIGNSAFYGCRGLTSLTIPEGVTSIGNSAFQYCSGLTSLTIPEGVTSISNSAFQYCSRLTSLTIPEGVTSIGEYTFYGCVSLTSLTIPEGVTSIGNYAFCGCSGLTSLTIPEGVTSIGESTFHGCSGLTSLTIPEGVTSIGNSAFYRCSSLTSLTIPEGVTSIGNSAFYRCSGLTSLTIPESVTSIGEQAFYNCSSLTSVYVKMETPPAITANVFSNRANATLYVPYGCSEAYEGAAYWQEFMEIVEMVWQEWLTADGQPVIVEAKVEDIPTWMGDAETPWADLETRWNDQTKNYLICAWGREKGVNVNEEGVWDPFPATIEQEADGNHYFIVHGKPATTEGAASAWDNQFWIQSPKSWKSGDQLKIHFRYKASKAVTVATECHQQNPGDYRIWHAIGDIAFTEEWQDFDGTMLISNDMAGTWSIAFQLNQNDKDAIDFYFDDLSWQSMKLDESDLYYLKNAETGKYLNVGNAWGTHAVLADEPLPARISKQPDGCYTIFFPVGSQNQQLLFRDSMEDVYVDYNGQESGCPYWTITDIGNGNYHIQSLTTHETYGQEAMPGTYLGNDPDKEATDGNGYALGVYNDVDGNVTEGKNITWTLEPLPIQTLVSQLQELVTTAQGLGLDTSEAEAVLNNNEATSLDMLLAIIDLQQRIDRISKKLSDLTMLITCANAVGVNTDEAQAVADSPSSVDAVTNAINTLREAYIAKLGEGVSSSLLPLNVTGVILNPSFAIDNADGWSCDNGTPKFQSYNNAEYYEKTFDIHQTVSGLPNGNYVLKVKGFHRPGSNQDVFSSYMNGENLASAQLYANSSNVIMENQARYAQENQNMGGASVTNDEETYFVPNSMYDARSWFDAGYYENELPFTVTDGILTFGIRLEESVDDGWVIFDDFRLEYVVAVTDITQMDNVIYIEPTEKRKGAETTISFKMKNTADIRGFQFDLVLPEGVTPVEDGGEYVYWLNADRAPKKAGGQFYHNLEVTRQADGSYRFLCGSQTDKTFIGNDGEVAVMKVNIADDMQEGDYPIVLKNVKLSETDISVYYLTDEVATNLTILSYIPGDINSDGIVDVSDYIGVANHILGNTPAGFNSRAADVNEDNVIDVSDYIGVANIILTGSIYGNANARTSNRPKQIEQEQEPQ